MSPTGPHCPAGHAVPAEAAFCTTCGRAVTPGPVAQLPPPPGAPLPPPPSATLPATPDRSRRSTPSVPAAAVVAAAVLVLVVLVAGALVVKKKSGDESASKSQQAACGPTWSRPMSALTRLEVLKEFRKDMGGDVADALDDLIASVEESDERLIESDIYFQSSTAYAEALFRMACLDAEGELVPTTFDCPANTPSEMLADSEGGSLRDQVIYTDICIDKFTTGPYPAGSVTGDIDCDALLGPVWVGSNDPNGLDADGDGIGCDD